MSLHPVLHRTAQPIAVSEFIDALRAAAPPRFPHGRAVYHRRVGMAISGGVDSMALAFLCAEARRFHPFMRISDAPTGGFTGLVIDHGLREGSGEEAKAVGKALVEMGHRYQIWPLRWPEAETVPGSGSGSGSGPAPTGLPSALETTARRLRYREFGLRLAHLRIVTLLLAHHEDDQYETVLMRLLSGYGLNGGIRGLRGMRAAADLPECQDIYGAHQSGFVDDQNEPMPYVIMRPSRLQRRYMKMEFREDMRLAASVLGDGAGSNMDRQWRQWTHLHQLLGHSAPPLAPLDTEDLGIVAYRPLLPFAKERLVATCLANNVPWFEDHTNADPTLTMRNALRYVAQHHALPQALQKPAILELAARCDATSRQHEAEARRLIVRHGVVVRFNTNVGTIVARLPRLQAKARRRPWRRGTGSYAIASAERRRLYLRTIAALVVQKLLAYVTPETNVTPVSQLQGVVDTLFPDLVDPDAKETAARAAADPKAFIICGTHFMPFFDNSAPGAWPSLSKSAPPDRYTRSWYLARAPYASPERAPPGVTTIPAIRFQSLALSYRWNCPPSQWRWSSWSRWNLYDGRFWVRIRTRLPANVVLQPFDREHSKPFREALAAGPSGPGRLSAFLATLKTYAPGKVRYTLPAIYASSDVSFALDGGAYWPEASAAENYAEYGEDGEDAEDAADAVDSAGEGGDAKDDRVDYASDEPPPFRNSGHRQFDLFTWERDQRRFEQAHRKAWPDPSRPPGRLLVLPTLGAHIPGIEDWLQWEVRYRKVDRGVLDSVQVAAIERMYS
ncbi:pp-loop family protein [Sporothrix schenckii 1099-18]|uniref:tRNA(Ile)-lysidine synthetase n=2 Tax=Sporothrix schenckii TaxID=29908 RepID=U7Q8T1_SPOS1|nr:pp-loop family protein [Sporothrix schenckii 1099-18]ERT03435.1 hypothetical protein HMPREF1624_01750 [Sporothrix schenckii ATCC 58251]KJR84115.1 pp-loop family protein [Sporothrix schenckii 1099-18]